MFKQCLYAGPDLLEGFDVAHDFLLQRVLLMRSLRTEVTCRHSVAELFSDPFSQDRVRLGPGFGNTAITDPGLWRDEVRQQQKKSLLAQRTRDLADRQYCHADLLGQVLPRLLRVAQFLVDPDDASARLDGSDLLVHIDVGVHREGQLLSGGIHAAPV